jgi:hypothetical protein
LNALIFHVTAETVEKGTNHRPTPFYPYLLSSI